MSAECELIAIQAIAKGQQTVRYYGLYSNKTRGQTPLIPDRIIRLPDSTDPPSEILNPPSEVLLIPAPPKQSARDMRPLWRDLILKTWGGDPLECPQKTEDLKTQDVRQELAISWASFNGAENESLVAASL